MRTRFDLAHRRGDGHITEPDKVVVGILAGASTLSPMEAPEREKLAECGVLQDLNWGGGAPVIRLACMTQADGPVSVVIPPWNGLLGRVLTRVNAGTPSSC